MDESGKPGFPARPLPFAIAICLINGLGAFDAVNVLTKGGPSDSTMFFTLYLYQKGFGQFDMGYASAMAWVLLVIIGVFTAINFIASKYWVFYDD